jgi:hypothetical protein
MPEGVGVPCQRMWDRLEKVWGETRAMGIAVGLSNQNEENRKIPLTDADPEWRAAE